MTSRLDITRARALHDGSVRRRIVSIFENASRNWARAPETITNALRAARELSSAERRFVAETVHELIRNKLRLEHIARTDEPAALLDVLLAEFDHPENAELRIAAVENELVRASLPVSYPPWLYARLVRALGPLETEAVTRAMNHRAPLTVRTNRLRGSRVELMARLAHEGVSSSPTQFSRDGLILDKRPNVQALAAFRDGWFEAQDEGSQLLAELVLAPDSSSDKAAPQTVPATVIDACAGAGGKTLALGAAMQNRGRLIALDVHQVKLDQLLKRAQRAGLANLQTRLVDGVALPADLPRAERVLVDAPCSGLGVLRRHPETRYRLTELELDALPKFQGALLARYAALVAPGGRLVYATCSLLPEENDQVVADFLAAHPRFRLLPTNELLGAERARAVGDGRVLRLLPHRHDTDGFFGAALCRQSE